ncbi:MAG: OmpA family protein [Alphaproteobacteria bacterium]|nr:OmpA family protein [Alphaproteobacteria bacterium]
MNDHRQRALISRSSWRLAGAAAIGVVAFSGSAWAQETVIIGGSGQSTVEVNLEALRNLDGRASKRTLRFPGENTSQAIVLRAPGDARTTPAPRSRPALSAPRITARPAVAAPVAPVVRAPVTPPPARPVAPRAQEPATAAPALVTPPAPQVARQAPVQNRAVTPPKAIAPAPASSQQTAALPPADGQALRLLFEGSATKLNAAAQQQLQQMAAALAANNQRIQLKAFASGTSDRPSAARRESLSRALAVRSYLIENGVRSTRIDVRALGAPNDGGPSDRVDVILLTQ